MSEKKFFVESTATQKVIALLGTERIREFQISVNNNCENDLTSDEWIKLGEIYSFVVRDIHDMIEDVQEWIMNALMEMDVPLTIEEMIIKKAW